MTLEGRRLRAPARPTSKPTAVRSRGQREWADLAPPDQTPPGRNTLDGVVDEVIYTGEMCVF